MAARNPVGLENDPVPQANSCFHFWYSGVMVVLGQRSPLAPQSWSRMSPFLHMVVWAELSGDLLLTSPVLNGGVVPVWGCLGPRALPHDLMQGLCCSCWTPHRSFYFFFFSASAHRKSRFLYSFLFYPRQCTAYTEGSIRCTEFTVS